ncbi:MAG: sigma 54-interacting transcriptional regulator [Bacillaceae bacterium]|nr:sigma 54-interacting transcriptional regulator [Bacillaceae bacterium]
MNQAWDEIFESIYNGIVIVNRDGIVIKCNQSGTELIGLPREKILGRHITDVVKGAELHEVARDGVARHNQQLRIRDRIVLANRSPIYKEGKLIGAISVFQDITELERALSQLDEKEKEVLHFKEILELLYDGILLVDENGYVQLINQTYCDFLGVKMEEVMGKHCTEVVENSRMHIVAKTGQPEVGHVQKVGDKEIVVTRLPVRKNGKVVGAIGKVLFSDIYELKTLAQRLNLVESKLDYYKKELKRVQGARYTFEQIIGEYGPMKEAKELAAKVAKSRSTVLIRGESGTGKELFAHAIHEASDRSEGPFVRLNCAAIPPDLMEAELFGYEEGAFTGAKKGGKPGKIELAQGGTLFLDEIGDMPLNMQAKLLRVLQEKEVERVGGTQLKQVDIRIIAATNRPLEDMVKKGEFREDLYYRLNVFHVRIPPLRERGEDILTTARFILGQLNQELETNVTEFHPDVEKLFMGYHWPGNVRELQNVIERAIHMAEGSQIGLEHLPPYLTEMAEETVNFSTFSLDREVEKAEVRAIKRALKASGNNRSEAAELLGIHRASLYRKIEKYGIE